MSDPVQEDSMQDDQADGQTVDSQTVDAKKADAKTVDGQASPVRLLPAIVLLILMLAALAVTRLLFAGTLTQFMTSLIAPLACLVAMGIWLLFFSRLRWIDRGLIVGAFVVAMAIGSQIVHVSMLPLGMIIYVLPLTLLLPVLWMSMMPGQFRSLKRAGAYVMIFVPVLLLSVMRVDGISGAMTPSISLRWQPSAEDQYLETLATTSDTGKSDLSEEAAGAPLVAGADDWTGFRGPQRDGIARSTDLADGWAEQPIQEVWRRPVGPGWSSFALIGDRLFTQEQRGEEEAIVCMDAKSGETIWADTYPGRFYEVVGNAGPRATPTFDGGRIFALGATGKLTAVDAATGKRLWQADMAADTGAAVPMWGFSASPLVVDGDKVIVLAGDPGAKVIAYDAEDGSILWKSLEKGLTYSSAQLLTIDNVPQVVTMDGEGVFSLNAATGDLLWSHIWDLPQAARIVQPLQVDSQTLLIGTGYGEGTRKLTIAREGDRWKVEPDWTSRNMKPYFNDFVLHEGYVYGFDHEIIACIDAETGDRMWKKGRYGFGQMLLVPEDDVLVILGEKGELAFVRATPEKSEAGEIFATQAFEGKTWNHPVLVGNRLYLRNAEEAVCYELAGGSGSDEAAESDSETTAADQPAQP